MANLVMDFLHAGEDVARVPLQAAEDFSNTFANIGNRLAGGQDQTIQQNMGQGPGLGTILNASQATGKNRQLAADTAQIGTTAFGGELASPVGGAVESALPEATNAAGKIGVGLVKGAAEGATIGGAANIAQKAGTNQKLTGKNLTMDFLQGTEQGALTGGVIGGAVPAVKAGVQAAKNAPSLLASQAGAIGSLKPSDQLGDDVIQKLADSDNEKTIQKQLEPITGPKVAQDISPAIAKTNDPNVVKNLIDNDLNNKLSVAQQSITPVPPEVGAQSPAPPEITPTTPTSNVNTPQQVAEQATQAEATYTPPTEDEYSLGKEAGMTPEEVEKTHNNMVSQGKDPYTGQPAKLEAPKSFMNAPGEAEPTTHINDLDALTQMKYQLENGQSPMNAISDYLAQHNEATPEYAKGLVDKLMGGDSGLQLDKSLVGANSNPEFDEMSKLLPEAKPNDSTRGILGAKTVHNVLTRTTTDALDKGNELSSDALRVMDTAHDKSLDQLLPQVKDSEKPAFTAAWNALKKNSDTEHGIAAGAEKLQVPYRENHLGQMRWDNTPDEIQAAQRQRATLNDSPGFGKGRTIANYDEGRALGLTPKNDAGGAPGIVYRDLVDNLNQKQSMLGQQALYKGLKEAYGDKISTKAFTDDAGDSKGLQIPYGNKIYASSDLADELNKRAPAPEANGFWKGYDKLNGDWKNIKLSGGLFHAVNTGLRFMGNQLATGNFFKHPLDSGKAMGSFLSQNFTDKLNQEFEDSGYLIKFDKMGINSYYSGAEKIPGSDLVPEKVTSKAEGNLTGTEADIKSGLTKNVPILKQMHAATFERAIPTEMRIVAKQQIDSHNWDFDNPDDLAEAVKVGKQINSQWGSPARDIQSFTPRTAKILDRLGLALGWEEGQIRAITDAVSKGGVEGKLARQTLAGQALLVGGIAAAGGWAGGEFKGKTPKEIALDILTKPLTGEFKAGNYTVGMPNTALSNVGRPALETVQDIAQGKKATGPAEDFASARLAAIPSGAEQVFTNRNFSGNPIRGTDYYGRPIKPLQTAESIAGMAAPIPVAQGIQQGSGEQNLAASLANTLGVNARQTNTLEYAPVWGQTYIAQLKKTPGVSKQQVNADTEFFELLGSGNASKTKTLDSAEKAALKGNTAKADQIVQNYNKQLASQLVPWAQNPQNTQYFDNTMAEILRAAFISDKSVYSNEAYDAKTNPTAYGIPIQALQSNPVSNQGVQ